MRSAVWHIVSVCLTASRYTVPDVTRQAEAGIGLKEQGMSKLTTPNDDH
jgi:hypothetical protein